jgi:hypothetical protein
MHIIQPSLFSLEDFLKLDKSDRLVLVLETLNAEKLLQMLEREHWVGRKGYSVRGMWSGLIAGVVYNYPTIADLVRQLEMNPGLRLICGFSTVGSVPSEDAFGRFLQKLVKCESLLEGCFQDLVRRFKQMAPDFGQKVVADSTDIEAYSNVFRKEKSDPDARWGTKGDRGKGGKSKDLYWWFGYKLHLLVDAIYELPISFELTPANEGDTKYLKPLLEKAEDYCPGIEIENVIADAGYDSTANCRMVFSEYGAIPVIPLNLGNQKETPDICNPQGTPLCSCGLEMVYWGRDGRYLKYRCPEAAGKGKCQSLSRCTPSAYGYVLKLPIAQDYRRYSGLPRETKKWKRLYRLRSAVERVNSRLKEILILNELRVRGKAKVMVRTILNLLVMMAVGVGMAESQRLNQVRCLLRI